MIKKITILGFVAAMAGCISESNNELDDVQALINMALNKSELLQLLPGSTVYLNGNDTVQVGFYSPDNTMTGNIWGSREAHVDEGSWMVSDTGQFCNQWSGLWSNGQGQNCYNVYPGDADDQYLMATDADDNVSSVNADFKVITITPSGINDFE